MDKFGSPNNPMSQYEIDRYDEILRRDVQIAVHYVRCLRDSLWQRTEGVDEEFGRYVSKSLRGLEDGHFSLELLLEEQQSFRKMMDKNG